MCVGHHYPQANTNNVNKTRALLRTTGDKDEPTIVCMRKSQHGTQNVKTHNRRTQNTKQMINTNLNDR
jgi:fructose/tagatose bisphosphate aldolase